MIATGSILIRSDAGHPSFFVVHDAGYPDAWLSVTHHLNPQDLASALSTSGWSFFYMASPISRKAFGFNRPAATQHALRHVLAEATAQGCNCIEVDGVAARSFMGVPYVNVCAHARNIQRGSFFIRS